LSQKERHVDVKVLRPQILLLQKERLDSLKLLVETWSPLKRKRENVGNK